MTSSSRESESDNISGDKVEGEKVARPVNNRASAESKSVNISGDKVEGDKVSGSTNFSFPNAATSGVVAGDIHGGDKVNFDDQVNQPAGTVHGNAIGAQFTQQTGGVYNTFSSQTQSIPNASPTQTSSSAATVDGARRSELPALAGYNADNFAGEDQLGITPDVEAFAALIAAKDTAPPLSIGLFGAWGSGKTFFMNQLIQAVWRNANTAEKGAESDQRSPFHQHIAQIQFNAWHYVEGNLWASLVEHIFANLRTTDAEDRNAVQVRQGQLLEQLEARRIDLSNAQERQQKAQQELARAELALNNARRQAEEQRERLEKLTVANIISVAMAKSGAQKDLNQVRKELGWDEVQASGQNLKTALDETQAVVARGQSLVTPLLRTPAGRRRLVLLTIILVAAPLLGLLVGSIFAYIGSDALAQAATAAAALATLLGGAAEWLRRQSQWVSGLIDQVDSAGQKLDSYLASSQQVVLQEIGQRQEQVEQLAAAFTQAQQEQRSAEQQVAQAEQELQQATPERMLANFIRDRMETDDYRKYLGVLARVREDFERLSDIINDGNGGREDIATALPVNRIVLYIDDLDRCPPRRVVEVLQAVHLLLAFPLFVVVVAVDARWIMGSLQSRYRELLNGGDQAEPLDYLEKIFQIPFWISPMDRESRGRMTRKLFMPSQADGHASEQATPDAEPQQPAPRAGMLTIGEEELKFADKLVPLLGRSPRALKRFTNVYRLMKVRLNDQEWHEFVAKDSYKRVLFLLALVTNAPGLATKLFRRIDNLAAQQERPAWKEFCDQVDTQDAQDLGEHRRAWEEVRSWLLTPEGDVGSGGANNLPLPGDALDLQIWTRRVARYSFLIDSIDVGLGAS
jgi:hypothetical protein